jgi:serine/threonine protein kinase
MDPPANARGVRTSLPPGTRVGRYAIVQRIGAGGMAELFLARQDGPRRFAKPVALKLLHAHFAEDPEFVAMFEREARIAAGLVHPNVAQVLDVGVAEGEHFLALEYVHGRDLRRILAAQRGPLPLGAAVRIVADVARALEYLHTRSDSSGRPLRLVHRDVTPANVLVGFAGSVKLADFGIAKTADQTAHTRTGTLKGKFGYMAPEQYLQEEVDAKSDLYALGVVLYEVTTGRRAFGGPQTFSIMNRVLAGDYAPPQTIVPEYPPALAEIVARMLAVDPGKRPENAAEVVDALERFAGEAGLDTRTDTLGAFVSALFDHPEEPSLVTPEVAPSSSVSAVLQAVDEPSIEPPPRGRLRLFGLATIGVVGIAIGAIGGWRMAQDEPSTPAAVREPSVPAVSAIEPAEGDAPSPPPPGGVEPARDREVTGHAEPAADAAAVPAPASASASASPQARRAKKPRRRATERPRAQPRDDAADLSNMFPKAMQ